MARGKAMGDDRRVVRWVASPDADRMNLPATADIVAANVEVTAVQRVSWKASGRDGARLRGRSRSGAAKARPSSGCARQRGGRQSILTGIASAKPVAAADRQQYPKANTEYPISKGGERCANSPHAVLGFAFCSPLDIGFECWIFSSPPD